MQPSIVFLARRRDSNGTAEALTGTVASADDRVGAELVIHLMRSGNIRGSGRRAGRGVGREAGKATQGVGAVVAALPGPGFGEAGGC